MCVGNSKEDMIRWENQCQKTIEACSEIGSSSNTHEGQNIFSRREIAVVNSCHELLEVSRQTLKEVARQAIQCAEDYERENRNRNPCSTTNKAVQEWIQELYVKSRSVGEMAPMLCDLILPGTILSSTFMERARGLRDAILMVLNLVLNASRYGVGTSTTDDRGIHLLLEAAAEHQHQSTDADADGGSSSLNIIPMTNTIVETAEQLRFYCIECRWQQQPNLPPSFGMTEEVFMMAERMRGLRDD